MTMGAPGGGAHRWRWPLVPEEMTDSKYVRLLISDRFPNKEEDLLKLERDERELFGEGHDFEVGSYTYISEIFMEQILLPSLDAREASTLAKASKTIEELLECGRESILEGVNIRIIDYLLGFPEYWFKFRQFAGPNVIKQVSQRRRFLNFDPFSEHI
ncbi:hypothetical protein [Streptomyces sp. NPDC059491]|uniref:hypothetical protein n=1 Tax=Streptomyces sp. NPDC059491 TaxID=3346850 RepID=UPI0036C3C137